ncbi:DMT family transporter [Streptomyces sannanensis]|uniref:DMT family transporter n=1 Tax=Streptomyces sannanensis TaxID=285536 RepID=A0ABP6SL65_9ACTN
MLSVALAVLAAFLNAVASVLQRRAAAVEPATVTANGRLSWLVRLVRRPVWLAGAAAMAMAGASQAGALATGPLAVVQPIMTTELLFTLAVGSLVFRTRPGPGTWWAFAAMALGLAAFLVLTDPGEGLTTVPPDRWHRITVPTVATVAALLALSVRLRPAARAAVLGCATAIGFAVTAVLVKDTLGRLPEGVGAVWTSWQLYAVLIIGLASFLLLQVTLRAGTLVASQPALTLGDALLSVVFGAVLFDESIALGPRVVPEVAALALLVAGSVQLARSPLMAGPEKEQIW